MRKELKLRIPTPCHEDWHQMTPNEKGRFCSSCSKTVVDFTSKSDETIIKAVDAENELCGRFKLNQLNRRLVLERKESNSIRSIAAAALITLATMQSEDLHAQGQPKTEQIDSSFSNMVKGKMASSILQKRLIKGTVVDQDSLPLPGAIIKIKETSTETLTDFDGNYSLRAQEGDILVCSYIGYQTAEIVVEDHEAQGDFNLIMDEDFLGEVVVVGGMVGSYTYSPTEEEIKEKRKQRQLRVKNYFTFYKRKFREKREKRRLRRKAKRESRHQ